MSVFAFASRRAAKDKTHQIGLLGRIKLLVFKISFGHIGGLAAVGGYFFVTQLLHGQHTTIGHSLIAFPDVKGLWDHLLDAPASAGGLLGVMSHDHWTTVRHLIRPLYEGIFGGLLYVLVAYNPFKVKPKTDPGALSRIAIKLRFIPTLYRPVNGLQIALLPLTITLFSLPGVAVGYGVDQVLRSLLKVKSLAPTLSTHPSVVDKFYAGAFDAKIIGIFGSLFFAKRAALPVFNFILRYFAQRRALAGKRCHFYHPPAFKLLVKDYKLDRQLTAKGDESRAQIAQDEHGLAIRLAVPSAALVVGGLAGLGYWVLRYVAG